MKREMREDEILELSTRNTRLAQYRQVTVTQIRFGEQESAAVSPDVPGRYHTSPARRLNLANLQRAGRCDKARLGESVGGTGQSDCLAILDFGVVGVGNLDGDIGGD